MFANVPTSSYVFTYYFPTLRKVLILKQTPTTVPDWHRADIKAALEKKGWSLRQLALSNGIHESTLRLALSRRHDASEQLIAGTIGVKPEVIWPSRYGPTAAARRGRGRPPMRPPVADVTRKKRASRERSVAR